MGSKRREPEITRGDRDLRAAPDDRVAGGKRRAKGERIEPHLGTRGRSELIATRDEEDETSMGRSAKKGGKTRSRERD
ncbi:MAG: hypothetical protein JWL62_2630, partial [Hyphomicrobiales bacterium]|nr:hypothetical protein [Hyphomicrobiales bacterium]